MEKKTWGWKAKYLILFLWIFLFSCKAHQAMEQDVQNREKAAAATAAILWKWIQVTVVPYR